MTYKVIDLETTIRNKIGNHKASPHNPENKIVLSGIKETNSSPTIIICKVYHSLEVSGPAAIDLDTKLLVGHHIKFDLLYLLRSEVFKDTVWPKVRLWDTSIAEYLLTGQEHLYPSLDACAIKYGGTVKDSRIKELWESGVQTEDIDSDMLSEYLEGDLNNTDLVFQKQFLEMKDNGMLPLMWTQMGALKATIEMEHNGMYVDIGVLRQKKNVSTIRVEALRIYLLRELENIQPALCTIPFDVETALNSPTFLAKVLYGKPYEYTKQVADGSYKTGKKKGLPKFKNVTETVVFKELVSDAYGQKTDEQTLTRISKEVKDTSTVNFIKTLLDYRGAKKELSTYIDGIQELIFPDHCIHGSLNHTATGTGRLSSTNPNLQNISN